MGCLWGFDGVDTKESRAGRDRRSRFSHPILDPHRVVDYRVVVVLPFLAAKSSFLPSRR